MVSGLFTIFICENAISCAISSFFSLWASRARSGWVRHRFSFSAAPKTSARSPPRHHFHGRMLIKCISAIITIETISIYISINFLTEISSHCICARLRYKCGEFACLWGKWEKIYANTHMFHEVSCEKKNGYIENGSQPCHNFKHCYSHISHSYLPSQFGALHPMALQQLPSSGTKEIATMERMTFRQTAKRMGNSNVYKSLLSRMRLIAIFVPVTVCKLNCSANEVETVAPYNVKAKQCRIDKWSQLDF